MSVANHHGSWAIRSALMRVFVLPCLSSSLRPDVASRRHAHFGSAAELAQVMKQRQTVARTPALHPDIIEADFFPTICLIPSDSRTRGLQQKTPLPQLRQRLQRANAERNSVTEHEHLILIKAPKYRPGQEPQPDQLTALRAPRLLVKMLEDLAGEEGATVSTIRRSGGRLRLPIPVEEPLVKIMTGADLLKWRAGQERIEKEAARRERQEKEVELTWTIKDNDLMWSLDKIKQWLSEGVRVTIKLTRKHRWAEPEPQTCLDTLNKVREAIASIPDVQRQNISRTKTEEGEEVVEEFDDRDSELRGLGKTLMLQLTPKTKTARDTDTVQINMPWQMSKSQLKQHLKSITSTLKKGRNLRITVGGMEESSSKQRTAREAIFSAIRSECRQAKNAKVKKIEGDLNEHNGVIVFEVTGGVKDNSSQEIEVPSNLDGKDAEVRLRWIEEWLKKGLQISVWAQEGSSADVFERELRKHLPRAIIEPGEDDPYGQKRLMLSRAASAQLKDSATADTTADLSGLLQAVNGSKDATLPSRRVTRAQTPSFSGPVSLGSSPAARSNLASPASSWASRAPTQNSIATSNLAPKKSPTSAGGIDDLLKSVAASSKGRPLQNQFQRRY